MPGASLRLRDAGEEGFTLVELVVALVILPLIMGAIAVAIFVTLQDQSGISTKISDSVDSQVTSTYFVRDVESALYVTTDRTPPSTPWQPTAGPSVCGSGTSLLVSVAWPSTTDIVRDATVVSYWRTQLASGTGTTTAGADTLSATSAIFNPSQVGKGVAQAQAPASRTVTATVIPAGTTIRSVSATRKTATLSRPVTTAGGVSFVVGPELTRDLCKALPTPSTPSNVRTQVVSSTTSSDFLSPFTSATLSCVPSQASCDAAAQAGWVAATWVQAVTLAITQPSGRYDYNLTGSPRVTNAAGGLGSSSFKCPTGTCSLPTLLALGGGGVVTETSCGTGGSSITVVGDAVLNTGYFVIHNCATFSAKKIVATKTPCHTYAAARCPPGSITPTPPWTVPHGPVPDPLTFLTDPPAGPVQPCPAGSATLSPGQYKTCGPTGGPGPVTVAGKGQVLELEPGVYEFDTGVDVGGQGTFEMATATSSTGVLVYLPCDVRRNGNHVDTWATQCTETFTVKNGTVDLERTLTTEYAGLWYWQNKGDTKTMTATGQGSLVVTGILYAPGATVTVQGDNVTSNTPIGAIAAARFRVVHSHITITGF